MLHKVPEMTTQNKHFFCFLCLWYHKIIVATCDVLHSPLNEIMEVIPYKKDTFFFWCVCGPFISGNFEVCCGSFLGILASFLPTLLGIWICMGDVLMVWCRFLLVCDFKNVDLQPPPLPPLFCWTSNPALLVYQHTYSSMLRGWSFSTCLLNN